MVTWWWDPGDPGMGKRDRIDLGKDHRRDRVGFNGGYRLSFGDLIRKSGEGNFMIDAGSDSRGNRISLLSVHMTRSDGYHGSLIEILDFIKAVGDFSRLGKEGLWKVRCGDDFNHRLVWDFDLSNILLICLAIIGDLWEVAALNLLLEKEADNFVAEESAEAVDGLGDLGGDEAKKPATKKRLFKTTSSIAASYKMRTAKALVSSRKRVPVKTGQRHGENRNQTESKGTSNPVSGSLKP